MTPLQEAWKRVWAALRTEGPEFESALFALVDAATADGRRMDWRVWATFMFTDNSKETQALPDDKLRELICRNIDIKERFEERRILYNALNEIASWTEGVEVNSSFDEPCSARMAREALAEVLEAERHKGYQAGWMECGAAVGAEEAGGVMQTADVLALVWLSRNMTDAILQTLRRPEDADWSDTDDALTVIEAMPMSQVKDDLRHLIKRARGEA